MLAYVEADIVALVIRVQGTQPQEFVLMRPKDSPGAYQLPSTFVDCHESPESAALDLLREMIGVPLDARMQRITSIKEGCRTVVSVRCCVAREELRNLSEVAGSVFEAVQDRSLKQIGLPLADRKLMSSPHPEDFSVQS